MTDNTDRSVPVPSTLVQRPGLGLRRRLRPGALKSRLLAPLSTVVYRWYTRQLMAQVQSKPLPGHLAMILDGNRRFARRQGLEDVSDGHRFGADKVSEVVRWCNELRIPVVTLWGLSTDNLGRDPEEVSRLLEIVGNRLDILSRDSDDVVQRRVRVMGRLEMLPDELRQQIQQAEELNAGPPRESEFLLNVAVAYGGRDEILDAFRQMLRAKGSSGESAFAIADGLSNDDLTPYLYAPDVPEPDLIIRTSGEVRLSGFLMWQSVYSELYFCDAPWPAFRKIDFLRAIRSFQARRRRFGQ